MSTTTVTTYHCPHCQQFIEEGYHYCPPNQTPPTPMPSARATFDEAHHIIGGDRRQDYGDARQSFARIAQTWSAVLGVPVTPQQVCLCMIGLKVCREANGHKHDSLVDICGYTGLLAEMEAATAAEGGSDAH